MIYLLVGFGSALFLVFLDAEMLDYFIWMRDFEHALQSNKKFDCKLLNKHIFQEANCLV